MHIKFENSIISATISAVRVDKKFSHFKQTGRKFLNILRVRVLRPVPPPSSGCWRSLCKTLPCWRDTLSVLWMPVHSLMSTIHDLLLPPTTRCPSIFPCSKSHAKLYLVLLNCIYYNNFKYFYIQMFGAIVDCILFFTSFWIHEMSVHRHFKRSKAPDCVNFQIPYHTARPASIAF